MYKILPRSRQLEIHEIRRGPSFNEKRTARLCSAHQNVRFILGIPSRGVDDGDLGLER